LLSWQLIGTTDCREKLSRHGHRSQTCASGVIDQFAEKVDSKSTIMGSDVKVGYMGGVRSNKQFVNYIGTDGVRVNGHIVTKKGRHR